MGDGAEEGVEGRVGLGLGCVARIELKKKRLPLRWKRSGVEKGVLTFLICAFHCWIPIRTLTVFCMRPADTTTAGICRVAAVAILVVDILFSSILASGEMHEGVQKEGAWGTTYGTCRRWFGWFGWFYRPRDFETEQEMFRPMARAEVHFAFLVKLLFVTYESASVPSCWVNGRIAASH